MELPIAHPDRSFALRLSYSFARIPTLFWNALIQASEGVFATAHNEGNAHVHIAMWNVGVTHDVLRKKIVALIKEHIETDPPKGNALMSVKKWNGLGRYLVYMLKGKKHDPCCNSKLSDTQIEYLRAQWQEGLQEQRKIYNEWKESIFFPRVPEGAMKAFIEDPSPEAKPPTITFDTIRERAIEYVLMYHRKCAIDAKVRYDVKDLVSNYCHYNKFKMQPIYI